ncbi:sporulation protein [Jeotgalibacillus proteolyticus]|uniref:sporulation protein n=1 Tax=Jeotgalibacillus proteolyticus TaxID=2082395 RepID=UPI003CE6BD4E
MSLLNKALASIGIGSLKIDSRLSKPSFRIGETVDGKVLIKGGSVEQEIDAIYLCLITDYLRNSNNKAYKDQTVIKRVKVSEPFTVLENEIIEIPFSFVLPMLTPITANGTSIWIKTEAGIKNAKDPTDRDLIIIKPSLFLTDMMNAVLSLGFTLDYSRCHEAPERYKKTQQYIQCFYFKPLEGKWQDMDNIEIVFFAESADTYDLFIEVNNKVNDSVKKELYLHPESIFYLRIRQEDVHEIPNKILQLMKQSHQLD